MKPLYLLDTDIVSYILKGTLPGIRARVDEKPSGSVVISAITAAELRYWLAKRPGPPRIRFHIEDFFLRIPTLPWDAHVAATHGELKARLFEMGRPLSELDMQIAAHAIALDAILVTHDKAFSQIAGLRTEDWV